MRAVNFDPPVCEAPAAPAPRIKSTSPHGFATCRLRPTLGLRVEIDRSGAHLTREELAGEIGRAVNGAVRAAARLRESRLEGDRICVRAVSSDKLVAAQWRDGTVEVKLSEAIAGLPVSTVGAAANDVLAELWRRRGAAEARLLGWDRPDLELSARQWRAVR